VTLFNEKAIFAFTGQRNQAISKLAEKQKKEAVQKETDKAKGTDGQIKF
jgi:hypothetical protein